MFRFRKKWNDLAEKVERNPVPYIVAAWLFLLVVVAICRPLNFFGRPTTKAVSVPAASAAVAPVSAVDVQRRFGVAEVSLGPGMAQVLAMEGEDLVALHCDGHDSLSVKLIKSKELYHKDAEPKKGWVLHQFTNGLWGFWTHPFDRARLNPGQAQVLGIEKDGAWRVSNYTQQGMIDVRWIRVNLQKPGARVTPGQIIKKNADGLWGS